MEDSSTTDRTLDALPRAARGGHDNVGVVLQAYLRRTLDDVDGLDNVRLCKGIYVEPATIAFQEFDEVRANFVRCLERARRAGQLRRDRDARRVPDRRGAADRPRRCRARPLRVPDAARRRGPIAPTSSSRDGHRLRVYVPYGTHWYEYSLRRLQENPKIAGYVAADTVGRVLKR